MSSVQVAKLLEPVSEAEPCGPDLEYDPAMHELERLCRGKPEQHVGETVIAAEGPDWRAVSDLAIQLFGRTKDLRVAVALVRALLHTEGLAGFTDGLAVLRGLLDQHWQGVHPALDPDDDNDPTMRTNILADLCDGATVVNDVKRLPLVSVRGIGQFSLRDIALASGELKLPEGSDEKVPQMGVIEAAFEAASQQEMQALHDAATASAGHVKATQDVVVAQVGITQAPDLSPLTTALSQAAKALQPYLAASSSTEGEGAGDDLDGSLRNGAEGDGAQGRARQSVRGVAELKSRDDVVRALDRICEYYDRREPSSPVPLLLRRAKKLASMDFVQIVRNIAPDGVSQVETLRGPEDEA